MISAHGRLLSSCLGHELLVFVYLSKVGTQGNLEKAAIAGIQLLAAEPCSDVSALSWEVEALELVYHNVIVLTNTMLFPYVL